MTRLQSEQQRLYGLPDPAAAAATPAQAGFIDPEGRVRAMVLELSGPAAWAPLAAVWQGVQADLDLPAPAIAVSGQDGLQLWFSLAQAVPAAEASALGHALRGRYLGDVDPGRLRTLPTPDGASPAKWVHARPVPAAGTAEGRWSAFVAPDLAPVFAEEPWLDMPPNPEGQAELLSRLKCIEPAALLRAMAQLVTTAAPAAAEEPAPGPAASTASTPARSAEAGRDPRQFLLDVMNDERVALPLRIEAAKALLPGCERRGLP